MSVLVKTKEGKILLLSKGADSMIMARLASDQKGATIKAQEMIDEVSPGRAINDYSTIFQFAREGLRTMALGMREVSTQMELGRIQECYLRCLKRNTTPGKGAGTLLGFY